MKLFSQLLVLGLAAEVTIASNWFSKAGTSSGLATFFSSSIPMEMYLELQKLHTTLLDLRRSPRISWCPPSRHKQQLFTCHILCRGIRQLPYWQLLPIVYNKWHETELERWLSDHNVPYPTPADRKDLENLVKDNWQSKVAQPYNDWDSAQLSSYLKQKGVETKDSAAANKDGLVAQVKNYWYETEDKADDAWASVKDWIFDRWIPYLSFMRVILTLN